MIFIVRSSQTLQIKFNLIEKIHVIENPIQFDAATSSHYYK